MRCSHPIQLMLLLLIVTGCMVLLLPSIVYQYDHSLSIHNVLVGFWLVNECSVFRLGYELFAIAFCFTLCYTQSDETLCVTSLQTCEWHRTTADTTKKHTSLAYNVVFGTGLVCRLSIFRCQFLFKNSYGGHFPRQLQHSTTLKGILMLFPPTNSCLLLNYTVYSDSTL